MSEMHISYIIYKKHKGKFCVPQATLDFIVQSH